jgi:hypothetical protein
MSDKLPWFPFYVDKWEMDLKVRAMGPVARSYYMTLLMIQWREGVLPESRKTLQRLLMLPSDPVVTPKQDSFPIGGNSQRETLDYEAILDQVLECFESDGHGGLINSQLNGIRNEQLRIVEAKSKGGKKGIRILARVLQESSKTDGVDLDLDLKRSKPEPLVFSASKNFDLDACTSHVLVETGLGGRDIRDVVREVIAGEVKKHCNPKTSAELMIEAWRRYEPQEIPFKKGPESFFGTGEWRKPPDKWGGKTKRVTPVNPAELARLEQERNMQ